MTIDDLLPLYRRIDEFIQYKASATVAIDGYCASGKSSLASTLKSTYPCNIFLMDDFFLRPCQRTPERLGEPGGNIDYERFKAEIIEPLKSGAPFIFRPYDCHTEELSAPVSVHRRPLNIIEGVYSLHPSIIDTYDIKVFMILDEVKQRDRLMKRNAELYKRFIDEWIPMEKKYFDYYKIPDECDFIFDAG